MNYGRYPHQIIHAAYANKCKVSSDPAAISFLRLVPASLAKMLPYAFREHCSFDLGDYW